MVHSLLVFIFLLLIAAPAQAANLPALPRVYVDTSMPTTTVTKTVCSQACDYSNDQLQVAIDQAQLGTTITLEPGVTYTSKGDIGFILRNKTTGNGWIIIQTAAVSSLPPPGTRLTPAYSQFMPKFVRKNLYALSCEATAHHYRIIGVEFMNPGNVDTRFVGAAFVACGANETTLDTQSHHILFDRVYVHGPSAGGSLGVKFGLILQGAHQGVIDSTIEDITYGSDAITVWSSQGAGPFVIKNNALSSSGENIAFGGGYAKVPNLTPSDIEIRNNYLYKPLKWRDDPAYNSGPNKIVAKNLLELKHAQRVLLDGNVLENMWPSGQPGFALTFTPRQGGSVNLNPWTVVQDVTVTNNFIKNTANGIAISGRDTGNSANSGGGAATMLGGRYLIKNNLFVNMGGYPGTGIVFQLGNGVFDLTIQHNTTASYAPGYLGGTTLMVSSGPMPGFVLQNNLFQARNYPFFGGGGCVASNLSKTLPGFVWTYNVFAGPWPTPTGCQSSLSPQGGGNAYPPDISNIRFVNPAGGNYRLSGTSPFKNAGSDGKDIGVNWSEFNLSLLTNSPAPDAHTPRLPVVSVDTSMPATPLIATVCASGCQYTNNQLQLALDQSQLGTMILLEPGATYTPSDKRGFILRQKTFGTGWIILRTNTTLPPGGSRVTPSNAQTMAKIVKGLDFALSVEPGAHHYRIVGVEFRNPGNVDFGSLGQGGYINLEAPEATFETQPHDIVIDRCYVHGPPLPHSAGVRYGVHFGGADQALIDSYVEDIYATSDNSAVGGWATPGPIKIVNNYLAASGVNIFFGGTDSSISDQTPSDIEIRGNHLVKPLKWRDDSNYSTGTNKITTRHLLELAHAQRVLIDGNVFENSWVSARAGYALVLAPRQGSTPGGPCPSEGCAPWTVVQDIIVTNNRIKNTLHGIALSGQGGSPTTYATQAGGRFLIQNNLITGLGAVGAAGDLGVGRGFAFVPDDGVFDVTINHNTIASYAPETPTRGIPLYFLGQLPIPGFRFTNNLLLARTYPYSFEQGSICDLVSLANRAPGYAWTSNVLAGPWPTPGGCSTSRMPLGTGNAYPAAESDIRYVDLAGGNYRLSTTSPFKNAGSDGKDLGVLWDEFELAQNHP